MWLSRLATKSSKRSSGLLGLIVGNDRRLSTSLFQFLWTVVIVFCYGGLIAWSCGLIGGSDIVDAVTKAVTHAGACYMPTAPTNIFLVMGFSVVTLAMAKGITTTYVNRGLTSKEPATTPKFSDLLCDDDGNPDLSKIQLLTWTFIGAFTYVGHVFGMLVANNSDRNSFPDIDQSLMILMGIGERCVPRDDGRLVVVALTLASLTPARAKVGATVSIKVSGFGTTIGTVVFGDTVARKLPKSRQIRRSRSGATPRSTSSFLRRVGQRPITPPAIL